MAVLTAPELRARKRSDREGGEDPLVMVTAYDAPTARVADDAGVDLILVGDSMAMVVLGYEDTLHVTVDDMAHHVAAVRRARPRPFVVADLPWASYHTGEGDAVKNAVTLIRAGAQAVKLEGGAKRAGVIRAITDTEIPVVGHLGLTPQSMLAMGGFKVQAKQEAAARELVADAQAIVEAGCVAVVLEGVPDLVAKLVTETIEVPTIGIGAGSWCDGQVLVWHDVLGLGLDGRQPPKFVRRYADLHGTATAGLAEWADDVRSGKFPNDTESYHLSDAVARTLISH